MPAKTTTLNLVVTTDLSARLGDLAEQIQADKAEVIGRAIDLFEACVEAKHNGKHVWITDENGEPELEVIGLIPGDHDEDDDAEESEDEETP